MGTGAGPPQGAAEREGPRLHHLVGDVPEYLRGGIYSLLPSAVVTRDDGIFSPFLRLMPD
eukprot:3596903-Pyramimonas_sp.AAC.1